MKISYHIWGKTHIAMKDFYFYLTATHSPMYEMIGVADKLVAEDENGLHYSVKFKKYSIANRSTYRVDLTDVIKLLLSTGQLLLMAETVSPSEFQEGAALCLPFGLDHCTISIN